MNDFVDLVERHTRPRGAKARPLTLGPRMPMGLLPFTPTRQQRLWTDDYTAWQPLSRDGELAAILFLS